MSLDLIAVYDMQLRTTLYYPNLFSPNMVIKLMMNRMLYRLLISENESREDEETKDDNEVNKMGLDCINLYKLYDKLKASYEHWILKF